MRNLIPHPTSTHTAYFWQTPLPQKHEIPEKRDDSWKKRDDDIIITFFQVFLVFGVAGPIKSLMSGYSLDAELILHPTSSPDQNLSKNTGRYVENTNKEVVFSFLPPKLINIIVWF